MPMKVKSEKIEDIPIIDDVLANNWVLWLRTRFSTLSGIGKTKFGELLFHSRNYLIGSVGTKAIGFISIPILTRLLSTADYGIINVFNGYLSIFFSVLTLNCYVSLGRYYYEKQNNLRRFFGTLIVFVSGLLFCSFIGFYVLRDALARLLHLPSSLIVFIVPLVYCFVFNSWYEQILVPQKQSGKIATRNVAIAAATLILTVTILLFLEKDKYIAAIAANLIVGGLFVVYCLVALKPYYQLSFRADALKYMLRYSLPLLPYSLSAVILSQVGNLMINNQYGASDAGLFSLAINLSMVHAFVVGSFYQAWIPDYFEYMDKRDYSGLIATFTRVFNIILFSALVFIFFGEEMGMLLSSKKFQAGLCLIPVFIIGQVFNSIFMIYAWDIQYVKRNIYLSVTVLLSGLLNIVLNMVFMPRWGYETAAYTSGVSYLFLAVVAWAVSKFVLRTCSVPFSVMLKGLMCFLPFAIVPFLLQGVVSAGILSYAIKLVVLLAFLRVAFAKEFKRLGMPV